jgi:hypothetical protein
LEQHPKTALFPIKQDGFSEKVQNLFPFGVYHYNPSRKHHIVVTNTSLLFSGIAENFHLCPLNFELRKEIHDVLQEIFFEFYHILTQSKKIEGIDTLKIVQHQKKGLPMELTSIGKPVSRRIKPQKVAWMEIKLFDPSYKTENKKEKQDNLINMLVHSGLDYMWITLNPHMYYSPIAKFKNQKKNFYNMVSGFTKRLKQAATKKNLPIPQILIGFEITNNVYNPNLPKDMALDMYGNKYPDIPRPLNSVFWENEVQKPLTEFLQRWKNPKISNGVPIKGVVIDLEMYGRKTTGSYLPTMGFEPSTITKYLKPPLTISVTPENFSQYLIDNNLSDHYFTYLEKRAEKLATKLRTHFNKLLPRGIIGCYAPNISVDWFYKGFYKGLCTPKRPLFLFTFNTEFDSHRKWLEKNGIYAYHLGVLMLSKLKNRGDFKHMDYLMKHHDGAWLNRFCRFTEKQHNDWRFLEGTPLPMEKRQDFAQYLKNCGK